MDRCGGASLPAGTYVCLARGNGQPGAAQRCLRGFAGARGSVARARASASASGNARVCLPRLRGARRHSGQRLALSAWPEGSGRARAAAAAAAPGWAGSRGTAPAGHARSAVASRVAGAVQWRAADTVLCEIIAVCKVV
uniref:Uncharacterized protein n=1 Tax=Oryza sativa subsp. japonica TaxID=39947 RepID=Q6ZGJ0_ORYSJ|nr:hypothetical protein [Oryza sativa Japonica Group]BAD16942.1 hypothetical protein [Oryza sativa Japonica Group]